jgi:carboxyl-terminal processing protease
MKRTTLLAALLGILIGALGAALVQQMAKNRRLAADAAAWQKLNLALSTIDSHYVDTLNFNHLTDVALTAVLQALDPHSLYMLPKQLEAADGDLAGDFEGIGIQFNVPADTAVIIEVIPGGPSEKIGLQPGDRLLKVDDKVIAGVKCPQDSMVRLMRGPAGTKVTVTVKREREQIPFEITRGKIPMHSVDAAFMVSDTVAYVRVSKFSRTTAKEFLEALQRLKGEGMRRLIMDLRDNSGGFMDQALVMADFFLKKDQRIVYMEGRHYPRQEYRASGRGLFQDLPVELLINEYSASSSEIFTGALQDNGRATVYGRRSFGKGLVQEPVYFSDGSGIRLTVARYYTPLGRCLQKPYDSYDDDLYHRYMDGELLDADSVKRERGGIVPDVFVPMDTTRATAFYTACTRKATAMRFASAYFDGHKAELMAIDNFDVLQRYLDRAGLDWRFLEFARSKDGLVPEEGEWRKSSSYMLTQIRALVGRYSKLGDDAFYHIWLDTDDTFHCAMN